MNSFLLSALFGGFAGRNTKSAVATRKSLDGEAPHANAFAAGATTYLSFPPTWVECAT
jgi:hypothetical protein